MAGHVFIVRGDLRKIACDAFLISCSGSARPGNEWFLPGYDGPRHGERFVERGRRVQPLTFPKVGGHQVKGVDSQRGLHHATEDVHQRVQDPGRPHDHRSGSLRLGSRASARGRSQLRPKLAEGPSRRGARRLSRPRAVHPGRRRTPTAPRRGPTSQGRTRPLKKAAAYFASHPS